MKTDRFGVVSGKDLYEQSYDPVKQEQAESGTGPQKKNDSRKKSSNRRNQKALEDVKKAVQGRERR